MSCPSEKYKMIFLFIFLWVHYFPLFLCTLHLRGSYLSLLASLVAQRVECLPARWETWVWSLGWEDPLEKEMAPHSSTLAWRIQWTEEPGAWDWQRIRHDWAISLSLPAIIWNSAFRWIYLSLSPFAFAFLLSSAICKASPYNHFAFLYFFFFGMVLDTASYTVSPTSVHSSSSTLFTRSNPLNLFIISSV